MAGGGGSFDIGFDQVAIAGIRYGNGEVVITWSSAVPEPSTWPFMFAGITLLGFASLRRGL